VGRRPPQQRKKRSRFGLLLLYKVPLLCGSDALIPWDPQSETAQVARNA